MNIKILRDASTKQTWALRLVQLGDTYGLNGQLVHTNPDPLVEFYDTRYPHTPLGQYVSGYSLSTLLERPAETGLNLDGGVPTWSVSVQGMAAVQAWLLEAQKAPPILSNTALLASLRRAVQHRLRTAPLLTLNAPYADGYWTVEVYADGNSRNKGYAEESRGKHGTIDDLLAWEMVDLLKL